ncbi:MAG: hypothetical protein ACRD5G_06695 [Candidatus Acidiferrales bacterium]
MSNAIQIQFTGFVVTTKLREYSFAIKEGGNEPCLLKLTIPNEAFLTHRARYQDGPGICSERLQREVDANRWHELKGRLAITDSDLDEYRIAHSPKSKPRYPNKSFAHRSLA